METYCCHGVQNMQYADYYERLVTVMEVLYGLWNIYDYFVAVISLLWHLLTALEQLVTTMEYLLFRSSANLCIFIRT